MSPSDGARVGPEGSEAQTGAQGRARSCDGESYLSWDRDEGGVWQVRMECNGGIGGDCGWHIPFDSDDGITDSQFRVLHEQHLTYSEVRTTEPHEHDWLKRECFGYWWWQCYLCGLQSDDDPKSRT